MAPIDDFKCEQLVGWAPLTQPLSPAGQLPPALYGQPVPGNSREVLRRLIADLRLTGLSNSDNSNTNDNVDAGTGNAPPVARNHAAFAAVEAVPVVFARARLLTAGGTRSAAALPLPLKGRAAVHLVRDTTPARALHLEITDADARGAPLVQRLRLLLPRSAVEHAVTGNFVTRKLSRALRGGRIGADGTVLQTRTLAPTVADACASFYGANRLVLNDARLAANTCPDKKRPCVCLAVATAGAPAPGQLLRDTDIVVVQLFAAEDGADGSKNYLQLLDFVERVAKLLAP